MTKLKISLLLAPLVIISLYFNLRGLYCGLPSAERTSLIVSSPGVLNDITPALKETRDRVYAEYDKTPGSYLDKGLNVEKELIPVDIGGKRLFVDVRKIHSIRSALLQSRFADEQKMITSLANIDPRKLRFNPHYFQYGGVFVYGAGISIKIAQTLGLTRATSDITYYFTHPDDIRMIFAAPKAMSGILETLAIPLIFMLGRMLFGTAAGVTAAVLLAVIPAVPVETHALKPYVLFFPLMAGALIFSKKILDRGAARDYMLAGVFSGLCAGTLIHSGAVVFAALSAHFMSFRGGEKFKERLLDRRLIYLAAGAAAAFLVTNPCWLFAFKEVKEDFHFLIVKVPLTFSLWHVVYNLMITLPKAFGLPVYAAGLCGIFLTVKELKNEDKMLYCVIVPIYINVVLAKWDAWHYAAPIIPVFLLFAGRFAAFLNEKIKNRKALYALLAAASLYSLGWTLFYSNLFVNYEAFFQGAGRWINENIPKGSSIYAPVYPSFYAGYPPFSLLDYDVVENGTAGYIITAVYDTEEKRVYKVPDNYELVKTMSIDKGVLGKIYKREAHIFLDPIISVYKLK